MSQYVPGSLKNSCNSSESQEGEKKQEMQKDGSTVRHSILSDNFKMFYFILSIQSAKTDLRNH